MRQSPSSAVLAESRNHQLHLAPLLLPATGVVQLPRSGGLPLRPRQVPSGVRHVVARPAERHRQGGAAGVKVPGFQSMNLRGYKSWKQH